MLQDLNLIILFIGIFNSNFINSPLRDYSFSMQLVVPQRVHENIV